MDSIEIMQQALLFEEKIRDMYHSAASIIDDERGKAIFLGLANDEQSHVDFLVYSVEQLKENNSIDVARLNSTIPSMAEIEPRLERMKAKIPEQMLGDIKKVLNEALQLEKETSSFYRDACTKTTGLIREIFDKFVEIEERHVELVQIELDHASQTGMWFNFMEISLEVE